MATQMNKSRNNGGGVTRKFFSSYIIWQKFNQSDSELKVTHLSVKQLFCHITLYNNAVFQPVHAFYLKKRRWKSSMS
jgi:hypothetical protein